MKIDILTLFPSMFEGMLNESIIKRAINDKKVEINLIDFRKYSKLSNNQVDDTPYGGGPGMVLRCEPIFDCIDDIKTDESVIVMMTPDGKTYNQKCAYEFSKLKHLIIICGHYEGFDERIRTLCDYEISVGDYVLTGGEIPAMILTDSIVRLIDGVITKESLDDESFSDNLLDYETYTKPREYRGMKVPDVLLSGDHKKIKEFREQSRIEKTKKNRSDLLK
ncbi:MAG: tRNA (guanosine(37)-N1)-methyltransferase TrmD [Firmicutes bacterium]|nr:tRNA (guanosine(37)-N1)-methyltransferase TrmD [Bacillota bacterium]